MTAAPDARDVIEGIPDPATLDRMLAESLRRVELLRHLLRVARRKAAYDRPVGRASGEREVAADA
jgi:hypothetical protein